MEQSTPAVVADRRLIRPEDPSATTEVEWAAVLHGGPVLDLPDAPVVVVAPHPDDETLGAGGLIATATAAGRPVTVVVCTDGEAASPAPDLGRRRRAETRRALGLLSAPAGVEVVFVGAPDGALARSTAAVVAAVEPLLASRPLLVAPWEEDGHPDHDAAGRVCASLAADHGVDLWRYPVWAWHWATPPLVRSLTIGCLPLHAPVRDAKARAMAAFASQIAPADGSPVLTPEVLAHFRRPHEAYVLAPSAGR